MEKSDILSQIKRLEKNIARERNDENLYTYFLEEKNDLEKEEKSYLQEQIKDVAHYREMRKDFAYKVYYFLIVWCVCLFFLLLAQATCDTFHLSDSILIVLCGGTTISTVGLVGFVVQGLFNHRHK